jgi:hypothetical protein
MHVVEKRLGALGYSVTQQPTVHGLEAALGVGYLEVQTSKRERLGRA